MADDGDVFVILLGSSWAKTTDEYQQFRGVTVDDKWQHQSLPGEEKTGA